MKKALLFFLLLGLFPAYTSARPAGNFPVQASRVQGQAIAQQVKAQLKKQPSQPDTSFLVPEEASQDVIEKNPPQVIPWQQFLQLNKRAKERDVVSRRMDLKTLQQRTQKQNMIFHNSWPDYATLLKGFTYIYVGEMHGTQSTPAEMIRLLQAVRQPNPDKRILLTSEFSIAGQLDDFPLEQANTSSSLFQMYPEVKNAADALDID